MTFIVFVWSRFEVDINSNAIHCWDLTTKIMHNAHSMIQTAPCNTAHSTLHTFPIISGWESMITLLFSSGPWSSCTTMLTPVFGFTLNLWGHKKCQNVIPSRCVSIFTRSRSRRKKGAPVSVLRLLYCTFRQHTEDSICSQLTDFCQPIN